MVDALHEYLVAGRSNELVVHSFAWLEFKSIVLGEKQKSLQNNNATYGS